MSKITKELPFIIHGCSHDYESFPTHTHGLTAIGLPELLIDPLAFGKEWNAFLINDSYFYLTHPEKTDLIPLILGGETVTVKLRTLSPFIPADDLTICFREVTPQFEAVKLAYDGVNINELNEMQFIQIYVEGDDFALDDGYYIGGVTW